MDLNDIIRDLGSLIEQVDAGRPVVPGDVVVIAKAVREITTVLRDEREHVLERKERS